MEKVNTMKEQTGNISGEMETANENQKETLEIKSTVTEMKTAYDGLEVVILKRCQWQLPKLKSKEKKILQSMEQNVQELWGKYKQFNRRTMGIPEGKGEKQKKIFEVIMSESFPKLMRYAKPDPGNSENTK